MAIILLLSALSSMALTWAARAYALRRQLLDEPGERRSHAVPTPRGGGAGPVAVFMALVVVAGTRGEIPEASWPWLVASLALVAGIGGWDDHRPLGATVRLAAHVVAGVLVALAFGLWSASLLLALAVVSSCVVMINVWNFMDGIDGIAGSQTAIVATAAAVLATAGWAWLGLALVACMAGFLPLNFPRARVFLGDVGSGTLGLGLAILGTALAERGTGPTRLMVFLLPAATFLVDSGLTLARRLVRREAWWTPHTQHLYQGLSRRYGHVPVTLAYAGWSTIGLLAALALADRTAVITAACVGLWYMACAAAWAWAQRLIRKDDGQMRDMDR